MTFLLRCVVLALASFAVTAVVSSALVALSWWRRHPDGAPAERADALLRLRLWPAVAASLTSAFVVSALWRFEARDSDEAIGWVLTGGAACGAVVVGLFFARLSRMYWETRRLLSLWLDGASPITLDGVSIPAFRIQTRFPVVAVVGAFRPTLVVDASVLDACTPEELSAILAHEGGHIRRWDNLRRVLFSAAPDLLALTPIRGHLADAWRVATEEAADDVAAERGGDTRVHLAQALLRVARLAPRCSSMADTTFEQASLPASALYRGDCIERRVRRLCETPVPAGAHRRDRTLAIVLAVVTIGVLQQRAIHKILEVVIAALP